MLYPEKTLGENMYNKAANEALGALPVSQNFCLGFAIVVVIDLGGNIKSDGLVKRVV